LLSEICRRNLPQVTEHPHAPKRLPYAKHLLYDSAMGAHPIPDPNHPQAHFQSQDSAFVALVDGAFADAAKRSGAHLLCRAGCAQCCVGVFAIGPADALRLNQGLAALVHEDPERAARVRERAATTWARLGPQFPGNATTGSLELDPSGDPLDTFEHFANHEPCPALDPEHGTCDLYTSRPQTCRVFGPPIAADEGYGVCELCFQTATPQEVAKAAITPPSEERSRTLDEAAVAAGATPGATIVAFVLQAQAG
jgi:Fe-S-cluster containining protein